MNALAQWVTDNFGNAFDFLLPSASSAAAVSGVVEWEAARIVMLAAKKRWLVTRSVLDKQAYMDAIARMQAGANKAGKKIETARAIAQAPTDIAISVKETAASVSSALSMGSVAITVAVVVVAVVFVRR